MLLQRIENARIGNGFGAGAEGVYGTLDLSERMLADGANRARLRRFLAVLLDKSDLRADAQEAEVAVEHGVATHHRLEMLPQSIEKAQFGNGYGV